MKISIIGTGVYSVALAIQMAKRDSNVFMWSENEELIANYQKYHHLKPITEEKIPESIIVTNNMEEVLKRSDFVLIGTTAKYVRSVCKKMKPYYRMATPICIASKGLEDKSCSFLSDVVKEELGAKGIGVISGPTFAADLINNELCALTLAVTNRKTAFFTRYAIENDHLKLRITKDLYGTQLCGSIKNVIAIAAGILDGLGYNESTKAFLINESVHDIKELLEKLRYDANTVLSYAGVGDLILTCSSPKSRNYQYGVLIGKKAKKKRTSVLFKKSYGRRLLYPSLYL